MNVPLFSAEEGAGAQSSSRPLPSISQIQGIKKFEFRIDETNPILKSAVEKQIMRLQAAFPNYQFSVEYGSGANPGG
jgi:hypothetical protein